MSKLATRVAALAASDTALSQASVRLAGAVESSPDAASRLRQFDRRLGADLAAELHQLKEVSRPAPIALDDVPVEFRERYLGANGAYLVRAFARESLWDYPALQRFTTAANSVDSEATGKSFRTLEGLHQMKVGFEHAALYALAAITFVLMLDLRRVAELALGLFPLAVGVVLTLGVMGMCGISLNPANMIALPLIVGVGVDNGVHVLHDYRRGLGSAYRLARDRPRRPRRGLTTVLGFGLSSCAPRGNGEPGADARRRVLHARGTRVASGSAALRDLRRLRDETKPEAVVLSMKKAA